MNVAPQARLQVYYPSRGFGLPVRPGVVLERVL